MLILPPAPGSKSGARRRLPLQWLLPLVTTAVLVGVLGLVMMLSLRTLDNAAIEGTQDRLNRSVHQLAAVSAAGVQQGAVRYFALTHDSHFRQALAASATGRGHDSLQAALARFIQPTDSGLPVELWTSSGRRVAVVGTNIDEPNRPASLPRFPPPHSVFAGIRPVDSLQLSELYPLNGRVYFWLVAPIIEGDSAAGYLAQQRRLSASPQTERSLRELMGTSVSGYYHNADGRFWTTLDGVTIPPRKLDDPKTLVAEERIRGTPLVFGLTDPRQSVLAGPAALFRKLALIVIALGIVGAVLTWMIARKISKPLVVLTRAAESVALGNYAPSVPLTGPAEVARLAETFNRMARQIGESANELEQREREFRALADAIPQLAWMADAEGSIFWYNRRWYDYTGMTFESTKGWGWQALHDSSRLPEVVTRWRDAIQSGRRFEMEFPLRGADGKDRWFLTRVEAVRGRDGEIVRWFGTNTDIQDLRDARESARAASDAKSEFLTTMSHELRTPLNAIGGYVELLEMGLRGPITEAQRLDLSRIRASQQHLLGLISGLLDLSRIESGSVSYEFAEIPIDLFLTSLDALVGPQALAKQLALECIPTSPELTVIADQEKLRQVLLNLLSNAIRYTPAGGRIVMTASAPTDEFVDVTVSDNGPGIPLERRADIFEPFVQLDRSLTRTPEGIGLGLSISRDLARGMNGELTVDSTLGNGATFTLRLPRARANGVLQAGG